MKKGLLSSVLASLLCASLTQAQTPIASPYGMTTRPAPTRVVDPAATPVQAVEIQSILTSASVGGGNETPCIDDSCPAIQKLCGPSGRVWIGAEYLMWWVKGSSLPPLVTTGPANPTQTPPPGALGANGTVVLSGGDSRDNGPFSGGRFTAGGWLNRGQTVGIEGSYFFLGSRSNNFTASSSGLPGSAVLARPFFDTSIGMPNSELISFPGLAAGTVSVHSTSGLQGAQINGLCNLCCSCFDGCNPCAPGYRVDLVGGVQYFNLREGLGVSENTQVSPSAPVFAGENIRAFDQIDTRNQFFGGQIGARTQVWCNRWFASGMALVALGDTHQTVDINGFTTFTPPATGFGGPGGMLALSSNIGHYSRDVFSVVPQVNFNIGCQVTNNLRVFVGYNLLYWSNVVRPADAIDLRLNSTRTPGSLLPPSGPASPSFAFRDSDFWAQGINLGLQARW